MAESGRGSEYTVHLIVRVEHRLGPEPEWDAVAEAVQRDLLVRGQSGYIQFDGSALAITGALIDTAEDLPDA